MKLGDGIKGFFGGFQRGYEKAEAARILREQQTHHQNEALENLRRTHHQNGLLENLRGLYDVFTALVSGALAITIYLVIGGLCIYSLVAFVKWCWQNS